MRALLLLVGLLIVLVACTNPPTGSFVLDPDPCNSLNESDSCYFALTQDNQTFSCPLIEHEKLRSLCYIEAVKFDPKEEYCTYVEVDDRKYCYAELGIALRDYSVCDKSEELSQQYCTAKIAELTNDRDTCDTLWASHWKNYCYDHFGRLLMDKYICFQVKAPILRDNCVYNVSIATNDVELCDSIVNPDLGSAFDEKHTTNECVRDLAVMNDDLTVCEFIDDSFVVQGCKYFVIKERGDVELCDEISVDVIRERCIEVLTEGYAVEINQTA